MDLNQLIVFNLGNEEYGINISFAKEIVRIPQITKVPNMPAFMEGIIDLRGQVIPIVDPKKKFGFAQTERGIDSKLLILDLEGMNLGVIVDDVSEVVNISENALEKLSGKMAAIGGKSIEGIYKIDERLILLINALEFKNEIF
ncbi:chemotaxis protein CheW [Desulfitobacterium sp. AusDCA]|uniref:chemotaxis protein CheW n=1 Tax=Desulfitobacterium sp. AusDCA TaxID=3240383 RepID=UPI003DA728AD